jgi:hypothetical protein
MRPLSIIRSALVIVGASGFVALMYGRFFRPNAVCFCGAEPDKIFGLLSFPCCWPLQLDFYLVFGGVFVSIVSIAGIALTYIAGRRQPLVK